jgi:hypothetical protein
MNTSVLKLFALIGCALSIVAALGVFQYVRAPIIAPETRSVLAWRPDFTPNANLTSAEPKAQSFAELATRPIFAPSRRPFSPLAPVAVEPPPQPVVVTPELPVVPEPQPAPVAEVEPAPLIDPDKFELKGIMLIDGKTSALIVTPDAPDGAWLANKSEIMGWKLARIDRNSVMLKGDGREVVLQQYMEKAPQEQSKTGALAPAVPPIPAPSTSN